MTLGLVQEWKETIGRQLREAERETEINKLVQVLLCLCVLFARDVLKHAFLAKCVAMGSR